MMPSSTPRVTPTQKKFLKLRARGQALIDEAERVRMRAAPLCKHPADFVVPMLYNAAVPIGVKCTFCLQVKYDDSFGGASSWGAPATMGARAKEKCTHPEALRVDYTWEHDNGYGRQSQVVGERCTFCGSRKSWKTVGSWMTEEAYYRPRRDD